MSDRTRMPTSLILGGVGGFLFIRLIPIVLRLMWGIFTGVVSLASKLALPAAVFVLFRWLLGQPKDVPAFLKGGSEPATGEGMGENVVSTFRQSPVSGSVDEYEVPLEREQLPTPDPVVPTAPDDLELIEGIGPAISGYLSAAGITTFRQLADSEPERLNEIMNEAGIRNITDIESWQEQARLAADGDWNGFSELISRIKAGRRSEA